MIKNFPHNREVFNIKKLYSTMKKIIYLIIRMDIIVLFWSRIIKEF